jgi:hypothetical protein
VTTSWAAPTASRPTIPTQAASATAVAPLFHPLPSRPPRWSLKTPSWSSPPKATAGMSSPELVDGRTRARWCNPWLDC